MNTHAYVSYGDDVHSIPLGENRKLSVTHPEKLYDIATQTLSDIED